MEPRPALWFPLVVAVRELAPTAVLSLDVVTVANVPKPMAVFLCAVVLLFSALLPMATMPVPVVLAAMAPEPIAMMSVPVPREVPLLPTPASDVRWFLVPSKRTSASKVDLATVFSTPLPSATTMLSELAPVCKPVMAIVLLALVTIVVGEPKVPPNFTSPLLAVSPLLALTSTGIAVVETPFTVDTKLPLVAVRVLVVFPLSRVGRLIDEDTPFTVLTRLPPDVLSALLLMMFTELPVTPLTVVVNVFVLEALLTVVLLVNNVPKLTDELTPFTFDTRFPPVAVKLLLLMIGAEVDVTPLTATVILLADDVRLLLLMIDTAAAVTPLTEVVKLFALEVLLTVVLLFSKLDRLTDELTPLTLEVSCPEATLNVLVVLPLSRVGRLIDEDTPFTVLTKLPPDVLSALLLMMFTPVPVTPFTVVVNVFVLEAFDTVVAEFSIVPRLKDEDTPFTVLTRLPPDVLSALLLMMFTPVPVTPFTVVVSVFVLEAFDTVVGIELALNCFTTPVASATKIWSEPLPVCSPSRRKGLEVAFTCKVLLGALVLIPILPAGEARLPFMPVPKIVFLMFIWLLAVPSMIEILLPINRLLLPVVTSVEVDVPVPTPRPMLLLPLVLPLSAW